MTVCACALCSEAFTGVTAFDAHQDRDYSRVPAVICRPPAVCGLVRNEYGRWGMPADEASRERLKVLRARQG